MNLEFRAKREKRALKEIVDFLVKEGRRATKVKEELKELRDQTVLRVPLDRPARLAPSGPRASVDSQEVPD